MTIDRLHTSHSGSLYRVPELIAANAVCAFAAAKLESWGMAHRSPPTGSSRGPGPTSSNEGHQGRCRRFGGSAVPASHLARAYEAFPGLVTSRDRLQVQGAPPKGLGGQPCGCAVEYDGTASPSFKSRRRSGVQC